jgi:hypothetical protein
MTKPTTSPTYRILTGGHVMTPDASAFKGKAIEDLTPSQARGYVWLFESPQPGQTYVIGVDPTFGIANWTPELTTDEDLRIDNAAVSVWRIGKDGRDYQVAEFAAPIDVYELAPVVNGLGRLYSGNNEMGQAHVILEVYPGPGWPVEQSLIHHYGYINYYRPRFVNDISYAPAKGIGWEAGPKQVRDLAIFTRKHIGAGKVVVRSPWLLSEMQDCKLDPDKFTIFAEGPGIHDDRVRAAALAWFAAHDFNTQVQIPDSSKVVTGSLVNWQQSDLSAERQKAAWEDRFEELGRI